ncbi:unnamed protein product, partial [Meganyctiphanes norvegica]
LVKRPKMAWTYSAIILLLSILSQTEYVQACNDDCKEDLIQRFENLLDNKIYSKMDLIKTEIENKFENILETKLDTKMNQIKTDIETKFENLLETKLNSKIDSMKLGIEMYFQNVLENKLNLKMEQISNTLTSHQDSMSLDLQSVKTHVETYERSFDDLIDPINDLKTLTKESNVILNEIRQSIEDCKGTSNTTTQQLNEISESIEDCKDTSNTTKQQIYEIIESIEDCKVTSNKTTQQLYEIRESIEYCKGTSNTTTQQSNEILETMEEIDQNGMEADTGTVTSMKMLSNEVESCQAGFFEMSTQCFKMFNDSNRSWLEAKTKCEQEGLILAQPDEAVAVPLRKYLYEAFGDSSYAWLGAQGDGSKFVYAHGGRGLDNASPLWYPGKPGSAVGAEYCLLLLVDVNDFRDHPTRPYWPNPCSPSYYALCE